MVQNVYIDKEWVANEYLRRCNAGVWKKKKKEKTEEALKCWNLGHILDVEMSGKKKPEEWTLEDVINEEHGGSPLRSDDVATVD